MSETPSFDFLAWVLSACRAEGTTGSLYLAGRPGGVFHLREGAVVAINSPGAPGTDALLLRSGRIREEDWSAVLRAGGTVPLGDLLADAGIGAAELRLITTMAAQDGAFAVVAGTIDEYAVDPRPLDVPVPVSPGLDLDRLLTETRRRIDALAALPTPVSPYRERLVPVPAAPAPSRTRRDIVACANGRRCARDIAFLLGRNVFPVTVEVSRLIGDGLLAIAEGVPPGTGGPHRPLRPRDPAPEAAAADPDPDLPQRDPGASGAGDDRRPSGWQVLPRLLNRIRAGPPGTAPEPNTDEPEDRKGTARGP
ncbi:hypothetical protein [Amycolatopsis solani]|uniref:hypothetical protein n=1 Tax=Amycolatopsis solani TaxID=3028615 RepID=UPI0025B015E6|nr:hypothetical protein [Amycolatopsis sp. MEP2-6]